MLGGERYGKKRNLHEWRATLRSPFSWVRVRVRVRVRVMVRVRVRLGVWV
jgi:hypothetical protein